MRSALVFLLGCVACQPQDSGPPVPPQPVTPLPAAVSVAPVVSAPPPSVAVVVDAGSCRPGHVLAVHTEVRTGFNGVAVTRQDHKQNYLAVHPALEFEDAPAFRKSGDTKLMKHYLPACNVYRGALPCLDFDSCTLPSQSDRAAFAASEPPLLTCRGGDVPTRVVHYRWASHDAELAVAQSRETDPPGTWVPLLTLHPKGDCVAFDATVTDAKRYIGNME